VANGKNLQSKKFLIIWFDHLWEVELAYRYIFAFKFTLRPQQPDIFPLFVTGINNTSETGGKICQRCR
jgi:hypothetical protein